MKYLLLMLLAGFYTGCSMMSADEGASSNVDVIFPKPIGDKIVPLEAYPEYTYHYTELDADGKRFYPYPDLSLTIRNRGDSVYGWDYESNNKGDLLIFLDQYDVLHDSLVGIYTVGNFDNSNNTTADTILLLPQWPERIKTWTTGWGTTMRYLAHDTTYYTRILYPSGTTSMENEAAFQEHKAYLLEETLGDTLTYYYFRKGIGLLGFERTYREKTVAVGTLFTLYRRDQDYPEM